MDSLDDVEIIQRYRLTRGSIFELVYMVGPRLERPSQRNQAIPPLLQILTTLRFYAKGGFLSEIGDIHGISRSSVSRIIESVTDELVLTLVGKIQFCFDQRSLREVKEDFHQIAGMPNVVGAIDGTFIPIIRPVEDEQSFVCRKGYHALNVQAICNANLLFTNVVAKWPGSNHDSFIWNSCELNDEFQRQNVEGWLLGDSGYPLKPWLLTPILAPSSPAEEKYNKAHAKTRGAVERVFGLLKSRIRYLHKTTGCLHFSPLKSSKITMACFILHNLCIERSIPQLDEILENNEENNNLQDDIQVDGQTGINARATLVRLRFS